MENNAGGRGEERASDNELVPSIPRFDFLSDNLLYNIESAIPSHQKLRYAHCLAELEIN
jgi:hypothetical protein